ncbi:MAG: hypothetical protein UU76_C0008G0012 [Parcubacteria group bacterium GW2011_GWC1_41_7]|nr:MAG: hypothetical protein UU76_C0008G0012 [Parcubacteria group bacterium GW2011_GWC1_41_7]
MFFALGIFFIAHLSSAQAAINLNLHVYSGVRGNSNLVEAGSNGIPTDFFAPPTGVSVKEDTDYRLWITGLTVGQNFVIKQEKIEPPGSVLTTAPFSASAVTMQYNGTFQSPQRNTYELWRVWIEQGSQTSNSKYFYLVDEDYANSPTGNNQVRATVNPGNITGLESSQVQVTWNKLFCPASLGTISIDKTRRPASGGTGDATLSGASISGSDFSSGSVDAVTKQITTTSHTLQTFYDFVIKSLGALISNKATLTVNPDVPAFEYACYVGFCYECDSGASPPSASCRVVNNQVCKNQTPSKDCKVEIRE